MIVIGVALLAIVTAVVLMVWPPARSDQTGSRMLAPPPAPERMDTNPLPPHPGPPGATQPPSPDDPWGQPGSGPSGLNDPPVKPDDIDPTDILKDPFAAPSGRPRLQPNNFAFTLFAHACNRIAKCGTGDDLLTDYCAMIVRMVPTAPPSCTAAQSCLDRIDQIDCATPFNGIGDLMQLRSQFKDCEAAMRC